MDASLPLAEFAFPGPLRDALVAAILDGTKTSTTSLAVDLQHAHDSSSGALPRRRVKGSSPGTTPRSGAESGPVR